MKPQILFSRSRLPGSPLIRIATWSRFSHCDLVTCTGTLIGAVAFSGVKEYPFAERLAEATHTQLFEVDADAAALEAAARGQLGKGYDWLACLGVGLHRDWRSPNRWFCSELIAWAFERAGQPLVNPLVYINRVTPETLLRSPLLKPLGEAT